MSRMNEKQLRRTIKGLENELQELDVQRANLEDALSSLRRLLPADPAERALRVPNSSNGAFPGTTAAIEQLIRAGGGRPVTTTSIRETFEANGWIKTPDGANRTHSIYETLRRLTKQGRLIRRGKSGYVLAEQEPPGDARKGDLLGVPRPEGGES